MQVALEWKASPAAPVTAPAREFTVEAGATRDLALEVQTDATQTKRRLQRVQIKVRATWAGTGQATIPVESLTFEVIPQHAPKFAPYQRLPARAPAPGSWCGARAAPRR